MEDAFCSLQIDAKKRPHCIYSLTSLVGDYGVVVDAHEVVHESAHHLKTL
jgi:hypothetical protein